MSSAAGGGRQIVLGAAVAVPVLAALAIRLLGGSAVLVGGELHAPLLDEEGYRRALALLPLLGRHAPLIGSLATLAAGLLAVALAAILGRRLASPLWAGVAAIHLALLPLGVEQSRLGRIDPQALEPAIALGFALCVLGVPGKLRFWAAFVLLAAAAILLPAPHLLCVGLGAGAALHAGLALGDRRRALLWIASTASVVVLAWLVRGPELLHALAPSRPLWDPLPLGERALGDLLPQSVVALLGYLPIAAPLLFLLALSASAGPSRRPGDPQLLAAWSGAFVLAGHFQVRFLVTGLALASPLVALGLAELARRVDQAAERRARVLLRRALAAGIAVGALTLLWPVFDYLDGGRPQIDQDRTRALAEAAGVLRAAGRGASQVLVLAPSGQLALTLSGISVTTAPYRLAARGGWSPREREVCSMLISEIDEESEGLAVRLGLGWLAFQELPSASTRLLLGALSLPEGRASHAYRHRRMLAGRLMADSGSGQRFSTVPLTAVSWLQHRWESRPVYGKPQLQLFRRVQGARIVGRAQSGALVSLRLHLVSNRGRPFRFVDFRRADREGGFSFRLPYPTASGPTEALVRHLAEQEKLRHQLAIGARFEPLLPLELPHTIALGPAWLSARGLRAEVHASREDVELGRQVPIEERR